MFDFKSVTNFSDPLNKKYMHFVIVLTNAVHTRISTLYRSTHTALLDITGSGTFDSRNISYARILYAEHVRVIVFLMIINHYK
jgi:hypothetical protein